MNDFFNKLVGFLPADAFAGLPVQNPNNFVADALSIVFALVSVIFSVVMLLPEDRRSETSSNMVDFNQTVGPIWNVIKSIVSFF